MKTLTKVASPRRTSRTPSSASRSKVRDTYFVHLTVANYELRQFVQSVQIGALPSNAAVAEHT